MIRFISGLPLLEALWMVCLLVSLQVGKSVATNGTNVDILRLSRDVPTRKHMALAEQGANVLKNVGEIAKLDALKDSLRLLANAAPAFAFLGSFFALVGASLPKKHHDAIMAEFANLDRKISAVGQDVKDLEKVVRWESTKLQYSDLVNEITLGVHYSDEIAKSEGDEEKVKRTKKRLTDLCKNGRCALAVWTLFEGILGDNQFTNNILSHYYDKSGGNRPKMVLFGTRLVQLLAGGISALMTYEAIENGPQGPTDLESKLQEKLIRAKQAIFAAADKCTDNFKENMQKDLEKAVMGGGSNKEISDRMFGVMKSKYDWLDICTYVYNEMTGSDMHTVAGPRVERFRFHKKNAVAFFKPKATRTYSMTWANYWVAEAIKISPSGYDARADDYYRNIKAKLDGAGIRYWGIAVTRKRWEGSWWKKYYGERAISTHWLAKVQKSYENIHDYLVLIGSRY